MSRATRSAAFLVASLVPATALADDFNIAPIAGGSSDVGVGAGALATVTRVAPGAKPYVWNVDFGGFVTVRSDQGRPISPYQDAYVKLTVPRLFGTRVRLEVRPSHTWETTLGYYGLGNASSDVAPPGAPEGWFRYARLHPALDVIVRFPIAGAFGAKTGFNVSQSWLRVDAGSKLAEDLRNGSPAVKRMLGGVEPQAVALFDYGLTWDDRDDEIAPTRGSFHELDARVAPGGAGDFPRRYAQLGLVSRVFVPVWKHRATLALRAVGDLIVGDAPFFELARFDDTYALGGGTGVRGVPAQRYYGKAKLFGNVELRVDLFPAHVFGKEIVIGAVAFFDAGRLWSELPAHPELDGSSIGLRYGAGGGLRARSGRAFVLRADIAWSPDARPIGGYFAANHTF